MTTFMRFSLVCSSVALTLASCDVGQNKLGDETLSGNVDDGAITQGMRQYDAKSGSDGHFVVYENPTANADVVRFLRQAVSGVPTIGD